jgi:hypothetical protein
MRTLTDARITFWSEALKSLLSGVELPKETIDSYIQQRDLLRGTDEKARQQGLH